MATKCTGCTGKMSVVPIFFILHSAFSFRSVAAATATLGSADFGRRGGCAAATTALITNFGFRPGRTTPAATALGGSSSAASLDLLPDQDDLEAYLLESKLVSGAPKETESPLRGFVGGTQFDADGFPRKVGEVLLHLAVEDEGDIGIELLLELP